jgi:hypothetical protein
LRALDAFSGSTRLVASIATTSPVENSAEAAVLQLLADGDAGLRPKQF